MTAVVGAPERNTILNALEAAERRARVAFRLKVAATWVALIGVVLAGLWITENIDFAFIGEWGPFILGGAGLTIVISVVSVTFATILALVGAIARLSGNPYFSGLASLYVSLARGTPLIVQLLFVYLALPQVDVILNAV